MNNKRVIYFGFDEERQYAIDKLYLKYKWNPVMIIGSESEAKWSEIDYSDVIFQDSMSLRKGQFDYSEIGSPVPIDENILHSLSNSGLNYLGLSEDATGWNYSFSERKQFYYDMLKFWNTVINQIKPDLVVFFTWPHTQSCYAFYLLLKYHYSIDLLFLDPIPLLNKYHLVGVSLERPCTPFIALYESDEDITASAESIEFLELSRKGVTQPHIVEDYKKSENASPIFRWKEFARLFLSTVVKGTGFKKAAVAWKKNKLPYFMTESRMNNFEYFMFVELRRYKNKRLRKYYDPLCVEPDFNKKYIYFAASYQPEARTNITCGPFEDQFLALDILASSIPEDWIIYYKENLYSFDSSPWSKGSLRRDEYYFQRINSQKNIKLISTDISTFDLIDNAQIIATVSGTVAWESVLRGKPAMSFGGVWYMGCKSIFWIKTLQDAQNAIKKVLDGYIPDQDDIERYVAAIEKIAVKNIILRNFKEKIKECDDPKYEMELIADALYEAYERYYLLDDQ